MKSEGISKIHKGEKYEMTALTVVMKKKRLQTMFVPLEESKALDS